MLTRSHILIISSLLMGIAAGAWLEFKSRPIESHHSIQHAKSPLNEILATQVTTRSGEKTTIGAWKQKILVLNFWATWCSPCLKEIPDLSALRQNWASQDIELIGVAIDFPTEVDRFALSTPSLNYPVVLAPDEGTNMLKKLGNTTGVLPFTIIIDRTGSTPVIQSITGIIQKDDMNRRLQILKENITKNSNSAS